MKILSFLQGFHPCYRITYCLTMKRTSNSNDCPSSFSFLLPNLVPENYVF